mmetsp:Transcript_59666/g.166475  ORF Transcript_59666/g.166475 Transcript_59666/m.166475 type:complete len:97 (+) Transcript_59666:581-871(+)
MERNPSPQCNHPANRSQIPIAAITKSARVVRCVAQMAGGEACANQNIHTLVYIMISISQFSSDLRTVLRHRTACVANMASVALEQIGSLLGGFDQP